MNIQVILVPYDSGYSRKRMGCGPDRIFEFGLKPLLERTGIRYESQEVELELPYPTEISAAFALCRSVAERVRSCKERDIFPIVVSGNCNVALGTVSGSGSETGIIWFDAHGEATTPETTRSGFLDGMPISILTGKAWRTLASSVPGFMPVPGDHIALFGARDLEPAEETLLKDVGVARMTTAEELSNWLLIEAKEFEQVYVHVDLDVLDPSVATANQWTPPNGISPEVLKDAIAAVREHAKVGALGIASYDPQSDKNGKALSVAVDAVQQLFEFEDTV
jgi:arginase